MTVEELIEELRTMRPHSDVMFEYRVEAYDDEKEIENELEETEYVNSVFYDKGGNVVLSSGEICRWNQGLKND